MYKQFVRYVVIGASSLAIDFTVYFFLTRFVGFFESKFIIAKIVGFFVSSIFNFGFNKKWTFLSSSPCNFREIVKYYSVAITALALNAFLMSGFLKFFPDLAAWFFAANITVVFNFLLSRFWVFSRKVNS